MKTLTYISIFLIIFSSCSKMLDIEPTNAVSSDEALKDKAGVEKAINGAYDVFQNAGLYGRNRIILGDLAADNLVWTGTTLDYAQIDNNTVAIDNTLIDGMWTGAYDGINRVNTILAALNGIGDLTDAERDQFEGEARFIRSLLYFDLMTYFGGLPVKTEPTVSLNNIDQARDSQDVVYELIIADLEIAESKLPSASAMPAGRANKYAATALLARVYLTRYHDEADAQHALKAVEKADRVITEGGFSLLGSYSALFIGTDNAERIFQVAFSVQDRNRLAEYFFPRPEGRFEIGPADALIQAYDIADTLRQHATIATDSNGVSFGNKYQELSEGGDPVMVIRLAEMYLIKAEALAYSNGDTETIRYCVDQIRTRAGLAPTTATSYDQLKMAIEAERRFEFAFEGHRWFDLVRTNRATAVLGISENQTLFPIPLSEMTTNKLIEQNPGY